MGRILFLVMLVPSMVGDNFDVPRAVIPPAEADSPLIIDSDSVLAPPITAKLLQSIAGRHAQVVQIFRAVQHLQLRSAWAWNERNFRGEPPPNSSSVLREANDRIIYRVSYNVYR
jgi:hypothetical protein